MKILSNNSSYLENNKRSTQRSQKSKNTIKKNIKKNYSRSEILDKLKKNSKKKTNLASSAKTWKDKKGGVGILKSDVGSNNPASDVTQEKLRLILKNGGFSFNQKEQAALSQILGNG